MKTLKQILEVYSPKSADEKRFVKKHIVVKTADVAGNGDDVYAGAAVKEIDRKKTRKGYNTKDSESVYEATYNKDVERAFPASGVKIGASAPKGTSTMPKDPKKAKGQPAGKMKEEVELDEVKKPMSQAEKDKVAGAVRAAMLKSYGNVVAGQAQLAAARLAAKIKAGKKVAKEEIEQVDELEKSTLKSYIDKARVDVKQGKKSDKREAGIKDAARKFMSFKGTANKKVAKEEIEQIDEKVFHTINGRGPWEGGVNTYNLIKKYKDPKTKENVHVVQRVHSAGAGKQDPSKHEVIVTDKDHKRIVGQTHQSQSEENAHKIAKHYIKHGLTGIGVGRTWAIGSGERPAQKGEIKTGVKKEEVEVNEVLKVSAGAGEWIKDFQTSDNPKFAGKSKEQRKQQALAAYYAAKRAGKE